MITISFDSPYLQYMGDWQRGSATCTGLIWPSSSGAELRVWVHDSTTVRLQLTQLDAVGTFEPIELVVVTDGIMERRPQTSACAHCTLETHAQLDRSSAPASESYLAATGLDPQSEHALRIVRRTEAGTEAGTEATNQSVLCFHGVQIDAGATLVAPYAFSFAHSAAASQFGLADDVAGARELLTSYKLGFHLRAGRVTSPDRLMATAVLALNALRRGVPGDFVEAGVYRGLSAVLMMKAIIQVGAAADGVHFFACDSFAGLPSVAEAERSAETNCSRAIGNGTSCLGAVRGAYHSGVALFMSNVRAHVPEAWLSTRLHVVAGWFRQMLPAPSMRRISFLRIDGDMYASTRDALHSLYPLVTPGGLVYVDDYGSFSGCGKAVDDFLEERGCAAERPARIWENQADQGGWSRHARPSFEAVWWAKADERSCSGPRPADGDDEPPSPRSGPRAPSLWFHMAKYDRPPPVPAPEEIACPLPFEQRNRSTWKKWPELEAPCRRLAKHTRQRETQKNAMRIRRAAEMQSQLAEHRPGGSAANSHLPRERGARNHR